MSSRVKRTREIYKCADDGRTIQSEAKGTDINNLLRHYRKTGTFTHIAKSLPKYGDFSNVNDYLTTCIQVKQVEDAFMECSADVRAKFKNDPAEMLDFLADPANEQEAIDLGLAEGERSVPAVQAELPPSPPDADEAENPVQGGD